MTAAPPRHITILGSTGSIGTQGLEVIAAHPDRFSVAALAAGGNLALLSPRRILLRLVLHARASNRGDQ